jgi:hypothetical protein
MTQSGHYLEGYLSILYGALPSKAELLTIPDPEIVARICFPDMKGLTLAEFAATFRGPAVEAMNALIASPRVQHASPSEDLVRAFNNELRQYSRRADAAYVAVCSVLAIVGISALGVPATLAGLSIELARRVMGRKAPKALATIAAKLTGTTREGALMAQIKPV